MLRALFCVKYLSLHLHIDCHKCRQTSCHFAGVKGPDIISRARRADANGVRVNDFYAARKKKGGGGYLNL